MMINYQTGQIVKSRAGHDKDELFVILAVEDEYVYLTDGKNRKVDKPKKKKCKHIQITNYVDENIAKIIQSGKVMDEQVRRTIDVYRHNI